MLHNRWAKRGDKDIFYPKHLFHSIENQTYKSFHFHYFRVERIPLRRRRPLAKDLNTIGHGNINMICVKCGGERYFEAFCKGCFIENTERKIRKAIKEDPLKRTDRIYSEDKNIIQLLREQTSVPFETAKDEKTATKVVVPWTSDDEIEAFIEHIIKDSDAEHRFIKVFKYLGDEELEAYSRIKGFDMKITKSDIRDLINKITDKSSEAKAAMLKGVSELQDLER